MLEFILFVSTNSAALAVVASAVIAEAFDVILAVLVTILEFKESMYFVRSALFAFKLILFDKLEVSTVTPTPPVEKL